MSLKHQKDTCFFLVNLAFELRLLGWRYVIYSVFDAILSFWISCTCNQFHSITAIWPPTKKFYQNFGLKRSCVCKELSTTSIGRLTDRAINLLQNYFGMAIRQNNDISSMKQAIEAVLFHCPESERNDQRHFFCPRTEKSLMWMERSTGKETHKTKISSLSAIKTLVKPIFVYLSNNSLLEKCLHRKTQNVN